MYKLKNSSDSIEFDGVNLNDVIQDMEYDESLSDLTIKILYEYSAASRGDREAGTGLPISPDEPENVGITSMTYFDPNSNEWVETEFSQLTDDFVTGYEAKILSFVHDSAYEPDEEYDYQDLQEDDYDDDDSFLSSDDY